MGIFIQRLRYSIDLFRQPVYNNCDMLLLLINFIIQVAIEIKVKDEDI